MAERTIKAAIPKTIRVVTSSAGVSFMLSLLLWKHLNLTLPHALISVIVSMFLLTLLFQLRFMPQMTVSVWSKLWGCISPLLAGSLFTLPYVFPYSVVILTLLAIIGIGVWAAYRFHPLNIDKRLHKSRFARLDEIEPLLCKNPVTNGLILGRVKQFLFFHQYVCVRPTKHKKEIGNSVIFAPTGGGKGNQIIGQIVAFDGSMIITDPKGDLFLETAGERAKKGAVYVLDPTRGEGHCYDPLQGKTEEGELLTVALNLVSQKGTSDTYWSNSAARMIMYLFKAARRENIAPLPYARHMIGLGLTTVAKRLQSLDPTLATGFLGVAFDDAHLETNRTIYGIWSTLQTDLTPILTETIVRIFARSDFTPETILRGKEPVTVYFRLEEANLVRLAPFIRVVGESMVKGLFHCWDSYQGRGCRKVLLSLDELGILPIPNIPKYVATGRSRDVMFQLVYQSPAQLVENYDEQGAQATMSNMDTKTYLRPNDQKTAQEIAEILGQGSQFSHSFNKRPGSEGEGLSEQAIPVMTAREIKEMDDKYALIEHRGLRPMKIHRLKWWQSAILKKRVGLPPPTLDPLPEIPELAPLETKIVASQKNEDDFINPDEVIARRKKERILFTSSKANDLEYEPVP